MLHLHPLTLEDILHQEAREKLEIFPRLGYYFIVFRALESERSRERFRRFKNKDSEGMTTVPRGPADEGIIGAVNVYLIVFREGICSVRPTLDVEFSDAESFKSVSFRGYL